MTKPAWIGNVVGHSWKGNFISYSQIWLRFNEFIYKIFNKSVSFKTRILFSLY